jgi:hypothetical protein
MVRRFAITAVFETNRDMVTGISAWCSGLCPLNLCAKLPTRWSVARPSPAHRRTLNTRAGLQDISSDCHLTLPLTYDGAAVIVCPVVWMLHCDQAPITLNRHRLLSHDKLSSRPARRGRSSQPSIHEQPEAASNRHSPAAAAAQKNGDTTAAKGSALLRGAALCRSR